MSFKFYLLAICDNIVNTCTMFTVLSIFICIIGMIIFGVLIYEEIKIPKWAKLTLKGLFLFAIFNASVLIVTPSTDDIIKTYCMTQGAKFATSENIKEISKELSNNIIEIITNIKEKLNR